jgi:hypothetical protein
MEPARANVAFIVPILLGLAVFAAIVLPGDGLSFVRFGLATAAFLTVAPGGAWLLTRFLVK